MNFIANIIGRLSKDPSLTTVTMKDGTTQQACHIRICVNDAYADKDENNKPEPQWVSVTAWNKQASWIAENLKKGDQISVSGHPYFYLTEKDGLCYPNIELRHPEFTFISNGEKKEKKVSAGGPVKGALPPKKTAAPAKTAAHAKTAAEEAVDVTDSVEAPF